MTEMTNAIKSRIRSIIYFSFAVSAPSRSFDYSAVRVQSSAPTSAPMPVSVSQLEMRSYVEAIRSLKPYAAAWVRWAYANRHPSAANHDMEVVARFLWSSYSVELEQITIDQTQRIMRVVQPALEQVATQQSTGKKRYSRADLYELSGCPESAWQRDMQPHWKALQDIMRNLDHSALCQLSHEFDAVDQRKALGSANDIAYAYAGLG